MERVAFQASGKNLMADVNSTVRPGNARGKRPCPTNLFSYKTVTMSNYAEEYSKKPLAKIARTPYRRYSRCNPHPLEAFLVWRLPKRFAPLEEELLETTAQLNPEQLIADRKVVTTYQSDYIGTQQGEAQSVVLLTKPASANKLVTSMQISYTKPRQTVNLKENTTRYGCGEGIVRAAKGIVPTLTNAKSPLTASYQTWYKSEFANETEEKLQYADSVDSQLKLPKIDARVQPQLTML